MSNTIDHSKIQSFGNIEFLARQVVEGFMVGLHKSPFHGFSVEFAEHRQYRPGESTKNIDWKLFGRTERLYVKRFEEETNLRCQVIMDTSSSMYFPLKEKINISDPNKITFSVYAAAALIHMFKMQRDAFGLSLFNEKVDLHTRVKTSSVHQKYLYGELEKLLLPIDTDNKKPTNAVDTIHEIAEKMHQRSLVIIFSDMVDQTNSVEKLFSALQHLKHNKHEVIMFHVHDSQKELNFNFENRPLKFIDLETGKEIKLTPSEVRDEYIRSKKDFTEELKNKCGNYKIDLIQADIHQGFDQVLLPYLLKRKKLY